MEINKIFHDKNKYEKWLLVEKAHLKYLQKKGIISEYSLNRLLASLKVIPIEVAAEELITKHDFVAFINTISKRINIEEKKWIHYGLTTTDVVDTANSLLFKEVNELLISKIEILKEILKDLAYKYKNLPQIGRTHGIHAEITSFGYKFAIFYEDLNINLEHLYLSRKHIECAKISGSVGTFANTSIDLQDFIADELGLLSSSCSTQTLSRERYANYFHSLNMFGQTINKIALELRHLARTEINEINEKFDDDQIGSSSMPHKKNPINLENICGLSRLIKGYSLTSQDNIALWNERDISHSSTERVLMFDATTILYNIINKISYVLLNMQVNEDSIKKNIELTSGNIYSQTALLKLISKNNIQLFHNKTPSREDLLLEIKKITHAATKNNVSFKEELLSSELSKYLNEEDLFQIFDPSNHIKYMDQIYKRIFKSEDNKKIFENILWNKYEIEIAIEKLAQKINKNYENNEEEVIVISTLDGAMVFTGNLLPKLNFKLKLVSCKISFYGEEIQVNKEKQQDFCFDPEIFKNKKVLILDDLLDTGETIQHIVKSLKNIGASDVKSCVLFTKEKYKKPKIYVDWTGLNIPDSWVVGYGIDSKKLYRNLNYLGVIKPEYC